MAATKRNYYEVGTEGGGIGGTRPSFCANFVTTEAYNAEYIVLRGWRQGSFTSVTAYLYAVDGSNKPTGSALATSQSIPGNEIPVDPNVTNITFTFISPYTVMVDTEYAIVVTVVGGNQSHNWFDWWIQNNGGYIRGVYFTGDDWYMYSPDSHWHQVWGSDPSRQITLTSPADEDTGVLLQPLLQWSIGGDGAAEGDLLDIYLRKDDANFTDDDLLTGLVDATLNSSLQVVAGLEYDATYYWQVQAFASEEDDLLSSSVFSFTVQSFSPPGYSIHPISGLPTGANNQLTVRRLIAAANGKIWYEDLS